ncbi:hypothetical protein BGW36DRAFT_411701 [Talaromyces proteolyticus]|uniref:Uncharacterized protein n=1 Tax=Talaromyces proteolyticus TaxID=1131652 RepID=A0AAD4KH45_9EURO|nr:uncharacterized protein BGW36DRAFT_411701 [Talaromyces proteolyticus]KAH8690963.1 hypothetical protein BGW36DRAFT_411701 [Talaromyces proteolyticus]
MTFTTESVIFRDANATIHTSVKDCLTEAGRFYGLLTVAAAHKSVIFGRQLDLTGSSSENHKDSSDLDYSVMKGKCIQALNRELRDSSQAFGRTAIKIVIHLIASSVSTKKKRVQSNTTTHLSVPNPQANNEQLILGFYVEAQTHLTGLRKMVELCGGLASRGLRSPSLTHAIVWSDHKIATGLMSKPIFTLPWEPAPLTAELRQQICPSPSSHLTLLGSAFWNEHSSEFSQSLIHSVKKLRDTLYYQNLIMEQEREEKRDNQTYLFQLYKLIIEAEHDLLSYPFQISGNSCETSHTANLNSKEAMARMGCICVFNSIVIVTPPAAGMGRSLTNFMKKSICTFTDQYPFLQFTIPDLNLLAWVLFIGAQGSLNQPEYTWFVSGLADVVKLRIWGNWADVVSELQRYIFMPRVQDVIWRSIWEDAISVRDRRE